MEASAKVNTVLIRWTVLPLCDALPLTNRSQTFVLRNHTHTHTRMHARCQETNCVGSRGEGYLMSRGAHVLYAHEISAPQNRKEFDELQSGNLTTTHFHVFCVYMLSSFALLVFFKFISFKGKHHNLCGIQNPQRLWSKPRSRNRNGMDVGNDVNHFGHSVLPASR